MAATSTRSRRFRVSIPKAVRDAQAWQVGQELALIPKGYGVLLVPVPDLKQLAGIAKGANAKACRDRKHRRAAHVRRAGSR